MKVLKKPEGISPRAVRFLVLHAEIGHGVVVANILYNLADEGHIVRHLTLLHHIAEIVAKNAAEVMVTGVGEERTAVGEHTDEHGEVTGSGEVL